MSLYLKHRPSELSQIKGNTDVVDTLTKMLENLETCPHVFMLHGPTGCGKTTIARIIAKTVGCIGKDFQEKNTADFRGIDSVRDIRAVYNLKGLEGPIRVWLIDECHKLTNDAQNAMLKMLEDTPKHVYFILCTTDPNKLIKAIHTRCSIFQVKPLTESEMRGLIKKVLKAEGASLETEVLDVIVRDSLGLPRQALQILDQVLNAPEDRRLEIAKQTAATISQSIDLCRALIQRAPWRDIAKILQGLKEKEEDLEQVRRAVLGYCQSILLKGKDEPLCGLIMEEFIKPFFDSPMNQLVFACYTVFKN